MKSSLKTLVSLGLSLVLVGSLHAQDDGQPAPSTGAVKKTKPATTVPQKKPPAAVKPAPPAPTEPVKAAASIEETRLTLAKWIETQQIISKERNDWQQGKEILVGRIELVGKEVSGLKEKIAQSEAAVTESNKKRDELVAEQDRLKASSAQLASAATVMEGQVRKLLKMMPEPIASKLTPLLQRIPVDPENTRVSTAERFQNVLGILSELNKANNEIAVTYEIRTLADGSSSECQVFYIGLAQAYYLSPRGEGGIGKPGPDGWKWQPAPGAAPAILRALEIIQGKESPAFVPLPLSIQ